MIDSNTRLHNLATALATTTDSAHGISYEKQNLMPNDIRVFSRTALRDSDYRNLVHHRYVLIFFMKQKGSVFINRHHFLPEENQTLLIRPFQQHYYAPPKGEMLWLFIAFQLPKAQKVPPFHQPAPISNQTELLLTALLEVYPQRRAQETALLLAGILHELGEGTQAPKPDLTPDQKLIADINGYIHDHLSEPFTLEDIGRHCGFSVSYLRMRFKNSMGITLGQHVHGVRINHARRLLAQTRLTASEIAYRSGFSSPAIFCRAFKNETGQTPLQFRRIKVENNEVF